MYEIRRTEVFTSWLDDLRDSRVRVRVLARLDRVAQGVFGDTKVIGETVSELRIDYGPGYRIYYTKRRRTVVFLLVGGDKSSQERDIKRAIRLAQNLEE
jgi:putative addiction module killer protein